MFYCGRSDDLACVRLMKSTSSKGRRRRTRKNGKGGEKKRSEKGRTIARCGRVRKQRLSVNQLVPLVSRSAWLRNSLPLPLHRSSSAPLGERNTFFFLLFHFSMHKDRAIWKCKNHYRNKKYFVFWRKKTDLLFSAQFINEERNG